MELKSKTNKTNDSLYSVIQIVQKLQSTQESFMLRAPTVSEKLTTTGVLAGYRQGSARETVPPMERIGNQDSDFDREIVMLRSEASERQRDSDEKFDRL